MKIRLAKKIMKQAKTDIPWTNLYWRTTIEIYDWWYVFILDYRITKAISLINKESSYECKRNGKYYAKNK